MTKVVTFGEVMHRLSPPGSRRIRQTNIYESTFAGGECNVAMLLAGFGFKSTFVSRVPDNPVGQTAVDYIRRLGVDVSHVQTGGSRIGVYYVESGSVSRPSQIVYDRSNSSFAEIDQSMVDWELILKDADWFHWTGITPAISEGAMKTCLSALKFCQSNGIKIFGDPNYRSGLWNYKVEPKKVLQEFISYSDVIVANEWDAEILIDEKILMPDTNDLGIDNWLKFCEALIQKFPNLTQVATTRRNSISASHNKITGLLFCDKVYATNTFDITHIEDRVGSGDAFAGGLIYGISKYVENPQMALNYASGCAVLNHTVEGDVAYLNIAEVEQLVTGNIRGRIVR